jgi:hypothetical protein
VDELQRSPRFVVEAVVIALCEVGWVRHIVRDLRWNTAASILLNGREDYHLVYDDSCATALGGLMQISVKLLIVETSSSILVCLASTQ